MDKSAQWPQGFGGVVKGADNPSSSGSIDQQQKRTLARPQKDHIVNCPRCNSVNTKFCYYNNYSLSQPRYFCKTCRRYWTAGGSLRNVPVGGGSRKNRRSAPSSSSPSVAAPSSVLTAAVHAQAQAQAGVANTLHQGHDLNLSFPPRQTTTHDDLHRHQYPNPTFTTTTSKPNFSIDHLSNTKLLSRHLPNPNFNMNPLLPPMGLFKNTLLDHEHSSREMMSSLMNPPEHQQTNDSINASIFSSAGFTPIHQDQFKSSSLNFSLDRFSNDHDGYAASILQLGVQQQSSDGNAGGVRLLFPFNQQENLNNKEHHKQVPSGSGAASSDVVQLFDHQHNINRSSSTSVQHGSGGDYNNGSSAGFWTGMLSRGSW